MNLEPFNISVQGATHLKNDKECQDASYSYKDNKCIVIAVSDGHGGEDYIRSAYGAKLASDIASNLIQKFLEETSVLEMKENHSEKLIDLQKQIIATWRDTVIKHSEDNCFTEEELLNVSKKAKEDLKDGNVVSAYGTTLIAVGMTSEYWLGVHIGDGRCVAINPEGKFLQPIPWDQKCFLNSTTSLCDSKAIDNFRNFFSEKLPVAVFLSTDGVDDCFGNNELFYNFYKTILYSFSVENFDKAYKELVDYLPRLSSKGSGDDISISAILNLDLIGEIEAVKSFDTEEAKARVQENERLKKEKIEKEKAMIDAKFEANETDLID